MAAPDPTYRALRVFAVDPGMTARFETALLNEKTLRIRWEELAPGPVGEYVEVVDEDAQGRRLHAPLDLDLPELLAGRGLPPSDGNPQFRQQMVYAVAMATIADFERALGRVVQWQPEAGGTFRRRLRLYPHFDATENAWTVDGRLCFGYFAGRADTPYADITVFTCLSQDVIAHELTHALLLGMDLGFVAADSDTTDTSALHEAFADLVALFQHFDDGEVLRQQIAVSRGDFDRRTDLGAVALQLGQALGQPDGLRNALGHTDEHGVWRPRRPTGVPLSAQTEPHERGAVVQAAVIAAFRKICASQVADLLRLGGRDAGAPGAELHPDLVARLSREASATAHTVRRMCIRALDYLPPVGVTFGHFLRAILTADNDLYPADERRYRVALLDAFRSYCVVGTDVRTLSPDTWVWPPPPDGHVPVIADYVGELAKRHTYWQLPGERRALWELREGWKAELGQRLAEAKSVTRALGLAGAVEVRSFDLRRRAGSAGSQSLDWIVKLAQKNGRSGVTLVVDANTGVITRMVRGGHDRRSTTSDLLTRSSKAVTAPPATRWLRIYTSDPDLAAAAETAQMGATAVAVRWERDAAGADLLAPGPRGEYLEVVDHDPASGTFYAPVDLDDRGIAAQDGLGPSESDPQFHQQMVYAVAMRIVAEFEQALGRRVLWAAHRTAAGGRLTETYVQRLRLHPHALREANAYYSPEHAAVLFGYFPALSVPGDPASPRLTVFTCLSQDIVAHEVTHAVLDGIHRRFTDPTNPDVLAFHEAFADVVALLAHFSLPEVLAQQISATRGDLAGRSTLGELAQQVGRATGRRGALRGAIGEIDPATGEWRARRPDPADYQRLREPHERGAILVAAVFDAFLTMYTARTADLLRIATGGSGVLPAGQLHPDLVGRLAQEAAGVARRVLHMCIRALDYCPPVDITFSDYLRAIVTADHEQHPDDPSHDRVALVAAFRRRGIVPPGIRTLSPDGLLWRPTSAEPDPAGSTVLRLVADWAKDVGSWDLTRDRRELFELMHHRRAGLHEYLENTMRRRAGGLAGIDPGRSFEVHSIRPSAGRDGTGRTTLTWVIEVLQAVDRAAERPVYSGSTLLVDAGTGRIRYTIRKGPPAAPDRPSFADESTALTETYFSADFRADTRSAEPFAALHRY